MSRSAKKPIYKDRAPKEIKRKAQRRVRKTDEEISSGSNYKKLFNSWDLCDFKFYVPKDKKAYRK